MVSAREQRSHVTDIAAVAHLHPEIMDVGGNPALILQLAQQVLGMGVTFYSRLSAQAIDVLGAFHSPGDPGALPVQAGMHVPLAGSYCEFVYRTARPLVVPDARHTPPFLDLAMTRNLHIGSYAGVPLIGQDGSIFGTLCGLHKDAMNISSEQVMTLQLLGHALVAGLERVNLLEELERQRAAAALAMRDELTGMLNRRAFDDALRAGIARAASERSPLALIFGDIDHFKHVNDVRGHQTGDAVLHMVAARMARQGRDGDHLFRFGGEEFVLLLPNTTAREALLVGERLRQAVRAPAHPDETRQDGATLPIPADLRLTMSFGVAAFPEDAASGEELITRADAAMYHAKRCGRDRCCLAKGMDLAAPAPNTDRYASETPLVNILSAALEAHDAQTEDHSVRLTRWTEALMRQMGQPLDAVSLAGVAAQLHRHRQARRPTEHPAQKGSTNRRRMANHSPASRDRQAHLAGMRRRAGNGGGNRGGASRALGRHGLSQPSQRHGNSAGGARHLCH